MAAFSASEGPPGVEGACGTGAADDDDVGGAGLEDGTGADEAASERGTAERGTAARTVETEPGKEVVEMEPGGEIAETEGSGMEVAGRREREEEETAGREKDAAVVFHWRIYGPEGRATGRA